MANRQKKKLSRDSEHDSPHASDESLTVRRGRDDEIRERAYELYLERGGQSGDEVGDWLRAEGEYRERSRTRSDGEPQDRL